MNKKETIKAYMDYITSTPEFKEEVKKVYLEYLNTGRMPVVQTYEPETT